MTIMTIDVDLGEFAVSLCGSTIKVWRGYGLPVFDGPLDGAAQEFPALVAQLVARGFVRAT